MPDSQTNFVNFAPSIELSSTHSFSGINIMQRYFIQFSYNGTRYHGWQIQQNSNTVQAELEKALSTIFEESVQTVGCGRTDAGVHARDFYAHFDSEDLKLDHPDRVFKLNKFLPHDIAIKRIIKVGADAHARFSATARTYKYYIAKEKDPFSFGLAHYFYGKLDVARMRDASEILFEFEDFGAFSKSKTQTFTNNCTIMQADWQEDEEKFIFTIKANRFLRNMVRAIVGTLIDVGRKKISLEEFRQ
ncbi:MAG: tRNA pseudouridine(38-40) synthase TruA, partial [Bacteroidetes bacterium]|nr:tRNA pseudouridine(38-40) synthase TruA [Bacteroidota bacterium]